MTKEQMLDKIVALGTKAQKAGELDKAREMFKKVIANAPESKQAAWAGYNLRALDEPQPAPKPAPSPVAAAPANITVNSSGAITDVSIPFWSIVVLMVKTSFAAIPALIIIWAVWAFIGLGAAGLIVGP